METDLGYPNFLFLLVGVGELDGAILGDKDRLVCGFDQKAVLFFAFTQGVLRLPAFARERACRHDRSPRSMHESADFLRPQAAPF